MDGSAGLAGFISEGNSITGNVVGDGIGLVTAIPGHNSYFVAGPWWAYGDVGQAGAVEWTDARPSYNGPVSPANALTGTHHLELVGESVSSVGNNSVVITSEYSVTLARDNARLVGSASADNSVLALRPGGGIPLTEV